MTRNAIFTSFAIWTSIFTGSLVISERALMIVNSIAILIIISALIFGGLVIVAFVSQEREVPGALFVASFSLACCWLTVIFSLSWVLSFVVALPIMLTYTTIMIVSRANNTLMDGAKRNFVYWSGSFLLVSIISFSIFSTACGFTATPSIVLGFTSDYNVALVFCFIATSFFVFLSGWMFVLSYERLSFLSQQRDWKSAYKEFVCSNITIFCRIVGGIMEVLDG